MLTASPETRKKIISFNKRLVRSEMSQWKNILGSVDRKGRVLEVGCGLGGKTDFLKKIGFENIVGIEINEENSRKCRERGLEVVSPEAFTSHYEGEKFDLIILSHIIEHFQHQELKTFLDHYLSFLDRGGKLFISTPTLYLHFWHDFDHIKPYYPQGIKNFYSGDGEQVSNPSEYRLKLVDLRYRRSPFRIKNNRNLLLKRNDLLPLLTNTLLAAVFKLSGGLIGHISGWVGLYRLKEG